MALSPEDIVNHDFKQALRGYAVREVDDLLDRLADQLERAERDVADLRQRVVDADARTEEARATESSLKRTLITAQDAAQRTLDEAQTHADMVRADAEREVGNRLDDAVARSTAMLEEAESEALAIRTSYRSEQRGSVNRVVELAAIEDRYRTQLRSLLEHELRDLERLEATGSPGGPEVDDLRDALPELAFDGLVDDSPDAATSGVHDVDGEDDPGGGEDDVELVPFGGLTVRVWGGETGLAADREVEGPGDADGHEGVEVEGDGHEGVDVDGHGDPGRDSTQ